MTGSLERSDAPGLDESSMSGLFALAMRLYSHQMYEQAARVMEYLLRHDPARPHYHRALGKALHAQGQYEPAVQAYARAVRLGLPDADVHFYIGQCLVFLRRYEMSAQAFDRCLQLARQQPQRLASLIDRAQLLAARVRALQRKAGSGTTPGNSTGAAS